MAQKNEVQIILKRLKSLGNPKNVAGMARFGINPKNTFGVKIPVLRQIGKMRLNLLSQAVKTAQEILKIDSKSAKWIATDALRELNSRAVQEKFKSR